MNQLIFNLVNPDVESLNIHLGVFCPCLCHFQPLDEVMDLLLIRFLSGQSFFLTNLKLLEVASNNSEFLFKFKNFLFLLISSLCCPTTLCIEIDVLTVDILIFSL